MEQADGIVVLGTALHDSQSRRNAELRAARAAELWALNLAPVIICCGGFTHNQPRSESAFLIDQLIVHGVPRDKILNEEKSTTTIGNAHYIGLLISELGIKSLIVVSTDYHLPRVAIIFHRMYPNLNLQFAAAPNAFDWPRRLYMGARNWVDRWKIWRRGLVDAPL
jgi:uncharacterized SAM-binding protein YcdF (DUF218 family)